MANNVTINSLIEEFQAFKNLRDIYLISPKRPSRIVWIGINNGKVILIHHYLSHCHAIYIYIYVYSLHTNTVHTT